jgi:hypothetical protein
MQQLNWTIINMTDEIIAQYQQISGKQTRMYFLPVSNDGAGMNDEAGMNSPPVSNNLIFAYEDNLLVHTTNRRLREIMAEMHLIPAEDLENE